MAPRSSICRCGRPPQVLGADRQHHARHLPAKRSRYACHTVTNGRIQRALPQAGTRSTDHVFVTDQQLPNARRPRARHVQLYTTLGTAGFFGSVRMSEQPRKDRFARAPRPPKANGVRVQCGKLTAHVLLKRGCATAVRPDVQYNLHEKAAHSAKVSRPSRP